MIINTHSSIRYETSGNGLGMGLKGRDHLYSPVTPRSYIVCKTSLSRIQISNTLCGYCWRVLKPFIAVLVTTVVPGSSGPGAMGVPYNG